MPDQANNKIAGLPGWLALLLSLLIVGGIAEGLNRISKTAGTMFALLVVLIFVAASGHTGEITRTVEGLYAGVGNK